MRGLLKKILHYTIELFSKLFSTVFNVYLLGNINFFNIAYCLIPLQSWVSLAYWFIAYVKWMKSWIKLFYQILILGDIMAILALI